MIETGGMKPPVSLCITEELEKWTDASIQRNKIIILGI